jgi:replication factor A1
LVEERSMKIGELGERSRQVNVVARVSSVSPPREVSSRADGSTHKVAEALVGDETGSILLTLWDDTIGKVSEGKNVQIKNGYISVFKGSMRLNIGRFGQISDTDAEVASVNTENNLSEKVVEQPRRFGGGGFGGGGRDFRPRFRPLYKDLDERGGPRGRGRRPPRR